MKKSNKLKIVSMVIGSILMGAISTTVLAQKPKHGPKINQEQVLNELNLNDDVRSSLKTLMSKQKMEMDSLREKKSQQRYQAHQEQKAIHEANKAEVKALLSEEQFAAFEKAIWMQRQQHDKGRRIHGQSPRR